LAAPGFFPSKRSYRDRAAWPANVSQNAQATVTLAQPSAAVCI
jgi:hypothetical protein